LAHEDTIALVAQDMMGVADNEYKFWKADNGQAILLLFISDDTVDKLNALRKTLLSSFKVQ